MIKIAVYTIALNEEKHVHRWYESAKDADKLFIADTGSTDRTRTLARSLGISVSQIEVVPWRFDVARNASLALVPEDFDICIQLDMDEVLPKGWRQVVEGAWKSGNRWPTYSHVTSRFPDGTKKSYQDYYFKIHPRKGFIWKYPIHEVLTPIDGANYERKYIDLEVDHLKDKTKQRSSYLGLLEMAVKEDPNDWRMNHYLCREYYYQRNWLKVLETANYSLNLQIGWDVEAASTYIWASDAAWNLGWHPLAQDWSERACRAAPNFYESWYWHAHIMQMTGQWGSCFDSASKIFSLSRQNHHLVDPEVWSWKGFDLIALSLHKIGIQEQAAEFGMKAIEANQNIERLKVNEQYYLQSALKQYSASLDKDLPSEVSLKYKFKSFPPVFVLNLHSSNERLESFREQCEKFGITNWSRVTGERPTETWGKSKRTNLDLAVHASLRENYHRMYTSFLLSGEKYGILCEDDVNFQISELWPFAWSDRYDSYKKLNFDLIQLSSVVATKDLIQTNFHLRRERVDWSSGIVLTSRQGAERVIRNLEEFKLYEPIESQIFDGLKVYTDPIFTNDKEISSTLHSQDVGLYHEHSYQGIRDRLSAVPRKLKEISEKMSQYEVK